VTKKSEITAAHSHASASSTLATEAIGHADQRNDSHATAIFGGASSRTTNLSNLASR
jgi:hypothetical protein